MSPGVSLLLVGVLIALNGLFVAAEFGFVAVRRGLIEERAEAGERRARLALAELRRLSYSLSAAQFGITVTSLLVGFLAEAAFGDLILDPLVGTFALSEGTEEALGVALGLLLSTVLQMLLGELAPKNLAIARPEGVSLALAGFMRAYGIVFGPIIRLFDRSAAWVSRRILGVEVSDELVGGHSLEELSRIISASGEEGTLTAAQAELLTRAVDLGDTRISEVMVPRPDVEFLPADETLDHLSEAARRTGHSRFPVRGETEDEVVGTIHIKDLLQVAEEERSTTTIGDVSTPALVVPESDLARRLLGQLRARHRTFAVVVDEYGGTAGIVTIEDLVEELVGEIEDEFDRALGQVRRLGAGRYLVRGSVRADRLGELLGVRLPEGDYETVAGFVIAELGHIPAEGEQLVHDGWEFEVARVDGVRVSELAVRRRPEEEPPAAPGEERP